MFYEGLSAVILGLPDKALNETLDAINANEDEKTAVEKVRDCFTEAGPENRFNNLKFKVTYLYPHLLENSHAA